VSLNENTVQVKSGSDNKLQELILYIAWKSEGDERFGKVKLNKLLFYSDFSAFLRFGTSITGEEYQALERGPAPRAMLPALKSLEETQQIVVRNREFHGHNQQKVFALREANLSVFLPQEIALVDDVIETFWKCTATEISNKSHDFIGWKLAKEGETIPYEVALLSRRELTIGQREYAKSLEKLADECLAGLH
jgi:uncharacterized phage-associated protein